MVPDHKCEPRPIDNTFSCIDKGCIVLDMLVVVSQPGHIHSNVADLHDQICFHAHVLVFVMFCSGMPDHT